MSTTKDHTKTKKFQALIAALGSEETAIAAWNSQYPDKQIATEAAADAPAAPLTSQEHSDVAVAKRGLIPVRGRVYGNTALIEAQVRVLKTGKPEIVDLSGEHRVKAVAVWRTEDGQAFATQNLGMPS